MNSSSGGSRRVEVVDYLWRFPLFLLLFLISSHFELRFGAVLSALFPAFLALCFLSSGLKFH